LLLGPLQTQFEVFGFWHDFIIGSLMTAEGRP
jgi:hypothetical protein